MPTIKNPEKYRDFLQILFFEAHFVQISLEIKIVSNVIYSEQGNWFSKETIGDLFYSLKLSLEVSMNRNEEIKQKSIFLSTFYFGTKKIKQYSVFDLSFILSYLKKKGINFSRSKAFFLYQSNVIFNSKQMFN